MEFNAVTVSCLQHVNKETEMTFDDAYKAYEQADVFTMLGFEVDPPKSLDGETFTIVIRR
jgi:hypothetical protein